MVSCTSNRPEDDIVNHCAPTVLAALQLISCGVRGGASETPQFAGSFPAGTCNPESAADVLRLSQGPTRSPCAELVKELMTRGQSLAELLCQSHEDLSAVGLLHRLQRRSFGAPAIRDGSRGVRTKTLEPWFAPLLTSEASLQGPASFSTSRCHQKPLRGNRSKAWAGPTNMGGLAGKRTIKSLPLILKSEQVSADENPQARLQML